MALCSLYCANVPFRNWSLTHSVGASGNWVVRRRADQHAQDTHQQSRRSPTTRL